MMSYRASTKRFGAQHAAVPTALAVRRQRGADV